MVWKAITDVGNAAQIISGIEKIEIIEQPTAGLVGLMWRETRMYFGKPSSINKWIKEADVNKFYKTRAEMDGFDFITTLTISGNDNNIQLTSTHETHAMGLAAKLKSLPMIFFKGMLKKAILKDLQDYKSFVETNHK